MKNSIFTSCDNCSKVVEGKDRLAEKKEPYLSVRGTICKYGYSPSGTQYYVYATEDRGAPPQLDFCNGVCLDEYMEQRRILLQQARTAKYNAPYPNQRQWGALATDSSDIE